MRAPSGGSPVASGPARDRDGRVHRIDIFGSKVSIKADPPPGRLRHFPRRDLAHHNVSPSSRLADVRHTSVRERKMAGFDLQSFLKSVPSTESRSVAVRGATKGVLENDDGRGPDETRTCCAMDADDATGAGGGILGHVYNGGKEECGSHCHGESRAAAEPSGRSQEGKTQAKWTATRRRRGAVDTANGSNRKVSSNGTNGRLTASWPSGTKRCAGVRRGRT